jgi:hypothetical protein
MFLAVGAVPTIHAGGFATSGCLQAAAIGAFWRKQDMQLEKPLRAVGISWKTDGTVGWDRTSDLRIHNPAL